MFMALKSPKYRAQTNTILIHKKRESSLPSLFFSFKVGNFLMAYLSHIPNTIYPIPNTS
jgi:hypothetical protein